MLIIKLDLICLLKGRKYTNEELVEILKKNKPIFVCEIDKQVVDYAFCLFQYLLYIH